REQGWTLRRIANEVNAALSTVSLWVRDIPVATPITPPREVIAGSSTGVVESATVRRRCGNCARDLPLTSFSRHPTGYQWWCRDCYRAYFRTRGHQHLRQVSRSRRERRASARAFVFDYLLTRRCSDCGVRD